MNTIYHVELLQEEIEGRRHFYFGSKKAIYDVLTKEQIGIQWQSLINHNLSEKPFQNKKCIIRRSELIRKKGNRGKK